MYLKVQRRAGREYLSVVQSYRMDGKVKSRTVETIGYADEYADAYDDPIAHFRAYVAHMNEDAAGERRPIALSLRADDVVDIAPQPPARLGAAVALGCLDALGMGDFFRARNGGGGLPACCGRVFEMLACERMMHATSKRESWTARSAFPRACDFSFDDVYRALPAIADSSAGLDACALRRWRSIAGTRDLKRIFLVCGSYAFPVDGGSMRASTAVAIDERGMPLGHRDIAGRLEADVFREASRDLKGRLDARRAVVIAGGLRTLEPTMQALAAQGDGFVLYQRDFERHAQLAEWTRDDEGYAEAGGGVSLKWRDVMRSMDDGQRLKVREVALRGGGYAVKSRHAVLVTSELDLSATAIVQLYRELWRQAEPFQPLEADFSSVPFATSARDHIKAHFAICYASFAALRLLRWKMGFSHNAADTADALLRMEGAHLERNYYLFSYRSAVTDDIEGAVGIPVGRKLRTRQDVREVPRLVRLGICGQG